LKVIKAIIIIISSGAPAVTAFCDLLAGSIWTLWHTSCSVAHAVCGLSSHYSLPFFLWDMRKIIFLAQFLRSFFVSFVLPNLITYQTQESVSNRCPPTDNGGLAVDKNVWQCLRAGQYPRADKSQ